MGRQCSVILLSPDLVFEQGASVWDGFETVAQQRMRVRREPELIRSFKYRRGSTFPDSEQQQDCSVAMKATIIA